MFKTVQNIIVNRSSYNYSIDTDADVLVFKGDKMLFTVTIGNEIKNE